MVALNGLPQLFLHARGSDAAFCCEAHLALELGQWATWAKGVRLFLQ